MFVQRVDGVFVLNPRHTHQDGFYETVDDELILFVYNKSKAVGLRRQFFERAKLHYVDCVGSCHRYRVELLGRLLLGGGVETNDPPTMSTMLWQLEVNVEQITNSKKRTNLLKRLVLGPTMAGNFRSMLDSCCEVEPCGGQNVIVRRLK